MEFLMRWLATAIACAAAIWLVPGIDAVGGPWMGPIFAALALSFVNAFIKPLLQLISLPVTFLTLGLFSLVVNAIALELASFLSRNIFFAGISIEGFGSAVLGAIIISIVSALASSMLGVDND